MVDPGPTVERSTFLFLNHNVKHPLLLKFSHKHALVAKYSLAHFWLIRQRMRVTGGQYALPQGTEKRRKFSWGLRAGAGTARRTMSRQYQPNFESSSSSGFLNYSTLLLFSVASHSKIIQSETIRLVEDQAHDMRDSSPFSFFKSKFRVANPDPSPLSSSSSTDSLARHRQRPRHASVDSYYLNPSHRVPHPPRLYESFEQQDLDPPSSHHRSGKPRPLRNVSLERNDDDGDKTAESQFRFIREYEEQHLQRQSTASRRSRRASVPIPPGHSVSTLDDEPSHPKPLDAKAQQLSQLIQQISDPLSYKHHAFRPTSPKRKRALEPAIPPPPPHAQEHSRSHSRTTRVTPRLIFDALARVEHIAGREAVEHVLDLHEWMMVHQLDALDREERDAVRAQDAEDLEERDKDKTQQGNGYERKKVFGVALRYISVYASTDVLLSSTSPSSTGSTSGSSSTSSATSTPSQDSSEKVHGHTLSLPIVLVSTIEELYRTGLYTPSLFRILPSPLRLRELVSVFNHYDLDQVEESVIVTPRPRARERGLSTRFGGSVSLHMEGVGEVGSVLSTWVGAVPGGVVGIEAYLNSSKDRGGKSSETRSERSGRGLENSVGGGGGWWRAVWEWCRVEEDDFSTSRSSSTSTSPSSPPSQIRVTEMAKIRTAQLLLHLLPQPAFDSLVYLLAFFSQVVLVGKTNGVGVRDVGGMFGRGVFGDAPPAEGSRVDDFGQGVGKEGGQRVRGREGSVKGAERRRQDGRSAEMMIWFLKRWDRISRGLFDVPQSLVGQQALLGKKAPSERLSGGVDVEASSTYTYPKNQSSEGRDGSGSGSGAGVGRKLEVDPDVRTVPLAMARKPRMDLDEEPTVGNTGRGRGGRDSEGEAGRKLGQSLERERGRRERGERDAEDGSVRRGPAESRPRVRDDDSGICSTRKRSGRRSGSGRRESRDCLADGGGRPQQILLSEGPPDRFFEDQELAVSPMEYDESWVVEGDELSVYTVDESRGVRRRKDTDATMVDGQMDEEARTPKASMSVDEMLDDMMKSYEVQADPAPPAMDDSLLTVSPPPHFDSTLSEGISTPPASVILPLHLKPKLTAQSLLDQLRQDADGFMESPRSSSRSQAGSVLLKTPVMGLYRSESGTFSVSSTSDLRARLMDVTMGSDDELHAGLVLRDRSPRIAPSPKTHRQGTADGSPVHRKKDRSNSRRASRRASVYDLEVELDRVKAQNDQAMGALEKATKQIHDLEERLRGVGVGGEELQS